MIDKNTVYIGQMLDNLTANIAMTAAKIDSIRKNFSECKIVLEENYAEDFVAALTKLFAQINNLDKAVCGKSYLQREE